jgi:hypothetical protein
LSNIASKNSDVIRCEIHYVCNNASVKILGCLGSCTFKIPHVWFQVFNILLLNFKRHPRCFTDHKRRLKSTSIFLNVRFYVTTECNTVLHCMCLVSVARILCALPSTYCHVCVTIYGVWIGNYK